jgi:hypothetical protein
MRELNNRIDNYMKNIDGQSGQDDAIYFNDVKFDCPTDFAGFIFPVDVYFDCAHFSAWVNFENAIFVGDVSFRQTKFKKGVNFTNARFLKNVKVTDAIFDRPAEFGGSENAGRPTTFKRAWFDGAADFSATAFKASLSFRGARFDTSVPDFRDAIFREATDWIDVEWPEKKPDDRDKAIDQMVKYQRLKAEMERLKRHEDELMFFAKELRARRAIGYFDISGGGIGFSGRLRALIYVILSQAYELISDYGMSVGRPALALLILFGAGAAYTFEKSNCGGSSGFDKWSAAFLTSMANSMPLPLYKSCQPIQNAEQVVGNIQLIVASLLLFLLGLGLRNKFRMK